MWLSTAVKTPSLSNVLIIVPPFLACGNHEMCAHPISLFETYANIGAIRASKHNHIMYIFLRMIDGTFSIPSEPWLNRTKRNAFNWALGVYSINYVPCTVSKYPWTWKIAFSICILSFVYAATSSPQFSMKRRIPCWTRNQHVFRLHLCFDSGIVFKFESNAHKFLATNRKFSIYISKRHKTLSK